MTQRFFQPGQDRHAGEKPGFTKKLKVRRKANKLARKSRKLKR
jgi:hypothetical protein